MNPGTLIKNFVFQILAQYIVSLRWLKNILP